MRATEILNVKVLKPHCSQPPIRRNQAPNLPGWRQSWSGWQRCCQASFDALSSARPTTEGAHSSVFTFPTSTLMARYGLALRHKHSQIVHASPPHHLLGVMNSSSLPDSLWRQGLPPAEYRKFSLTLGCECTASLHILQSSSIKHHPLPDFAFSKEAQDFDFISTDYQTSLQPWDHPNRYPESLVTPW